MIILNLLLFFTVLICSGLYFFKKNYDKYTAIETSNSANSTKFPYFEEDEQINAFAKICFNEFEDKYLVYSKRNENRFIMNKLIGKDNFYTYRIRKNDLDILYNYYFNQHQLLRKIMSLMQNKKYTIITAEICTAEDENIKNPTIIKIIVKV